MNESLAAPFAGDLVYQSDAGETITLGLLHGFVANEGNAWQATMRHLADFFGHLRSGKFSRADIEGVSPTNYFALSFAFSERSPIADELIGPYLQSVRQMAVRVAEMHKVLVSDNVRQSFTPGTV